MKSRAVNDQTQYLPFGKGYKMLLLCRYYSLYTGESQENGVDSEKFEMTTFLTMLLIQRSFVDFTVRI